MSAPESILKAENLVKKYREFTLDHVSLNIPKGYIIGLIGPNGAGKSTTIKILMNIVKPNSGDVKIFGLDYKKHEKEIKNRIGYVGEVQYFYENKSVTWTGKFVSQYYKKWDENRFTALLNDFQISRTKKVRELSKGMRVKLAMAIALSHDAELIILDEPTSGLDPVVRREVLDILMDVTRDENKSVIISSHITEDITRIADYITFMINGKIHLTIEKDDLLSNWKKIHFKKGALNQEISQTLSNVKEGMFGSSGITDNYLKIKDKLSAAIEKEDIKVENVGLDDILISFVKGE
ncbi:ABC transporter ATP-binding protein [candidate division KSB1 bacterium]|nr:ABC transporter ATP-binding protein [candidate division KSB1 bacterium]